MSAKSHRPLPARPSLEHLKKSAKRRLKSLRAANPKAKLTAAQLATAREFGFPSWRKLKSHVESLTSATAPVAADLSATINEFLTTATSHSTDPDRRAFTRAQSLLKAHTTIADNFLSACVLADPKTISHHLASAPALARKPAGPRNWPPLLYLAFSRYLRHDRRREPAFVRAAKVLVQHGADPNSTFLHEGYNETALYGAAGIASAPRLTKFLLDAGADPTDRAKDNGPESLYHACEHPDNACLKLLLKKNPRKDAISYCLFRKLDFENPAGVKLMLDYGADIHHINPNSGDTHLLHAIRRGRSAETLAVLLDHGANPNTPNSKDPTLTALKLARRLGQKANVKLLLDHGATAASDLKEDFLAACAAGNLRAAKKLLAQGPGLISKLTFDDLKILPDAAAANHLWPVRHMLNLGFPIDTPGDWGASAAHQAAWHGHFALLKFLLHHGANPQVKQHFGGDLLQTAIHGATHGGHENGLEIVTIVAKATRLSDATSYMKAAETNGHEGVIAFLKSIGETRKPPTAANKQSDWQGIMNAAFIGDVATVKRLLAAGVDPNVVSPTAHRHRPLHRAIESKKLTPRTEAHEEVVRLLLAAGADPTLRGTHSKIDTLHVAAHGAPRFIPLLRPYFEPLDIFHASACLDERGITELLGDNPTLATSRDDNHRTPLHYLAGSAVYQTASSAHDAQLRIARQLIAAGADPSATYFFVEGEEKWPISVLYHAAGAHDNGPLTSLLLDLGANPFDGESIFHAADEGHESCLAVFDKKCDKQPLATACTSALPVQLHWGRTRGMPWLLAHGADPNALSDRYGESALHAAIRSSRAQPVLVTLLRAGADPKVRDRQGLDAATIAQAVGEGMPHRLDAAIRAAARNSS